MSPVKVGTKMKIMRRAVRDIWPSGWTVLSPFELFALLAACCCRFCSSREWRANAEVDSLVDEEDMSIIFVCFGRVKEGKQIVVYYLEKWR